MISIMLLNNSRQVLHIIYRPYNLKTVWFVFKNAINFANRPSCARRHQITSCSVANSRSRDICLDRRRWGAIGYRARRTPRVHPRRMCIEISAHPARRPDPIDLSQVPSGPGAD